MVSHVVICGSEIILFNDAIIFVLFGKSKKLLLSITRWYGSARVFKYDNASQWKKRIFASRSPETRERYDAGIF